MNQRRRRALGCAPVDRIAADTAAPLPLLPLAPAIGWRSSGQLPRDLYVRLDSNDYSVHPSVIGRRIEVIADLDRVRAYCDGKIVADNVRVWAKHHRRHVLRWLLQTDDVYRRIKPRTPAQHLVSYFTCGSSWKATAIGPFVHASTRVRRTHR